MSPITALFTARPAHTPSASLLNRIRIGRASRAARFTASAARFSQGSRLFRTGPSSNNFPGIGSAYRPPNESMHTTFRFSLEIAPQSVELNVRVASW
ncbi:Uncharacterised protein [uncultured archaeon]|nr:Uncharacterised protein [uncultured archaeon]